METNETKEALLPSPIKGLQPVAPSEHILCSSWEKLASEAGFAFVPNEHIHDFFKKSTENQAMTTVSAYSDYGVHEQESSHSNGDLVKWIHAIPWAAVAARRDGYQTVAFGACDKGKCKPEDRYSIKIDRHTISTFGDVPDFVRHWYVANLNVEHPKMEWIPFGLNNDGPGYTYIPKHIYTPKTKSLYVNFQNHTIDRVNLKRHYAAEPRWATVRPEANVPVETYLEEMARHRFVLCAFGNGLDCYRTYEALYLGCIPILPSCPMATHMVKAGLPVLTLDNLFVINEETLDLAWEKAKSMAFDYTKLTISYWRERFGL